jgi:hypothetical protein
VSRLAEVIVRGLEVDLDQQLRHCADHSMTLRAAVYAVVPPHEYSSERYLRLACDELGTSPDIPVAEALKL